MAGETELYQPHRATSLSEDRSTAATVKLKRAREAVESWLDLAGFIDLHKSGIYKKLEECDKLATQTQTREGQTFLSESLPLISSIIHVGSSRGNFTRAANLIKENWPDADPAVLLSAFTFMYIVSKREDSLGVSLRNNRKRAVWDRISRSVDTLIN